jgi:hypothetical protein
MSHLHARHHSSSEHTTKKKSEFFGWLNDNSSFFWTQLIAILGFIGTVLEIIVHGKDLYEQEGAEEISTIFIECIFFLQFIFILIIIFILNRKSFIETIHIERYKKYHSRILKRDLSEKEKTAILKVNDLNIKLFGKYWLLFWKWIFLLYLALFAKTYLDTNNNDNTYYFIFSNVIATYLNNFSMSNIFICFLLIQSPLSSLTYNSISLNRDLDNFLSRKDFTLLIVNGFSLLHLFMLFCILNLNHDNPEKLRTIAEGVNTFFNSLSGIFNCVAVALLIARLDSKIVNVPSNLISILILYAAIQPMYIFFASEKNYLIVLLVSGFTLVCKVYFYLIVAYIINSGRLADLFMTFPLIKKMIEQEGYHENEAEENTDEIQYAIDIDQFNKQVSLMNLVLYTSGYKTSIYKIRLKKARRQISDTPSQ